MALHMNIQIQSRWHYRNLSGEAVIPMAKI